MGKKRTFSTEEQQEICFLYKEGEPILKIAHKFGCGNTTIRNILSRNNVPIAKKGGHNANTQEEWVKRCREKHGNKYDYSKSVYTRGDAFVIIACPTHGEFKQRAQAHQRGDGCKKCGYETDSFLEGKRRGTTGGHNKLSREDFVIRCSQIHEDKYDYSELSYTGMNKPVTIICKEHGKFIQKAQSHILGRGCIQCALQKQSNRQKINPSGAIKAKYLTKEERERRQEIISSDSSTLRSLTKEEWLSRARQKFGDKFEYSLENLDKLSSFIEVTCPIHGKKRQRASQHLQSATGCLKCGAELRGKRKSEKYAKAFIQSCIELHEDKYDYSKTICHSSRDRITVTCKKHGDFEIIAANHLGQGQGCGHCADELNGLNRRLSLEDFIAKANEAHKHKYDYSKTIIGKMGEKAIIVCPDHGTFEQDRSSHLQGHGCPRCADSNKGRDGYWNFVTDIEWANTKCYLYLALKDDYLKVGISNQLRRRSYLGDYDDYLETWESTRAACFTLERYILKQTGYAAIPEKDLPQKLQEWDGRTELREPSVINIEYLFELIDQSMIEVEEDGWKDFWKANITDKNEKPALLAGST